MGRDLTLKYISDNLSSPQVDFQLKILLVWISLSLNSNTCLPISSTLRVMPWVSSRWDQFRPSTVRGKVEMTHHISLWLGCILKVCLNRVACVDITGNEIIFHWFYKIKKVCTTINIRLAFLSFQKLTMSSILWVGSQGLKGHEQSSLAHPQRTLFPAVSCAKKCLGYEIKKKNSSFTFICFYCPIFILPNSPASARKFMKRLNSIQRWVH